eukprot:8525194-Pyramimonas_sp.AAC.1
MGMKNVRIIRSAKEHPATTPRIGVIRSNTMPSHEGSLDIAYSLTSNRSKHALNPSSFSRAVRRCQLMYSYALDRSSTMDKQ